MSDPQRYTYASISELNEALRRDEVTPVKITAYCLERIARLNPELNAFITVLDEQARQDAKVAQEEIEGGNWRGPLHGVPVAVKDFYDTVGVRTTAAFTPFAERVPDQDAEVVKRLKEAGAILLGKTNMHELGMGTTSLDSHFGPVINPWDENHVAGGSSGGSAAAVAAGLCYATVDTDAVGSCRLPAACCGVTGLKPTFGLISTKGILEGEEADDSILRLSHVSVTCRSARDAAILLDLLADPTAAGEQAEATYLGALDTANVRTLGVATNYKASDEVRTAFAEAVEVLRSTDLVIKEIEVPFGEASFDLGGLDKARVSISSELFSGLDALLLPTLTEAPPSLKEAKTKGPQAVAADNTFFANYFGLPAVSVPCGSTSEGLPLGLQVVGPAGEESVVLAVARRFQDASDWHEYHPDK